MKVIVEDTNLTNIANAIRNKNGSSDTYTPSQMSTAINNIPSGGGAFEVPDGMKFAQSSALPTTLDTSEVTDMSVMFATIKTTTVPQIDTSKATIVKNMFASSVNLISIPQIDTSKVTDAQYFCTGCSSLVNVPPLDFSSIIEFAKTATNCQNMFSGCPSLSNESLNNILAMCITMNPYSSHRTLKRIGLSSTQATTCQSLSNWDAFVSAGWSTGY